MKCTQRPESFEQQEISCAAFSEHEVTTVRSVPNGDHRKTRMGPLAKLLECYQSLFEFQDAVRDEVMIE